MKVSRKEIRKIILERDGRGTVTGGESGGVDADAVRVMIRNISPDLGQFLLKKGYLQNLDDRWDVNVRLGSGSLLPVYKAKYVDVKFDGGIGSFGGKALTDKTRKLGRMKKDVRKFLQQAFKREGLAHTGIKWGSELRVTFNGGKDVEPEAKVNFKDASQKAIANATEKIIRLTGESEESVQNIVKQQGPSGGGGKEGDGGKRRGGGSNKCVRELQEFLVEKGSKKTGDREYTSRDVDGKWGKNTRYAFYYYLTKNDVPENRGRNFVRSRAEVYLEENSRNGWRKILEAMNLDRPGYKGLCDFVGLMKDNKDGGGDGDDDDDDNNNDGGDDSNGPIYFQIKLSNEAFEKAASQDHIAIAGSGKRYLKDDKVVSAFSNVDKAKAGDIDTMMKIGMVYGPLAYKKKFKKDIADGTSDPSGSGDFNEMDILRDPSDNAGNITDKDEYTTFESNYESMYYNPSNNSLYCDNPGIDYVYKNVAIYKHKDHGDQLFLVAKDVAEEVNRDERLNTNESRRYKNKKLLREFRKYLNLV